MNHVRRKLFVIKKFQGSIGLQTFKQGKSRAKPFFIGPIYKSESRDSLFQKAQEKHSLKFQSHLFRLCILNLWSNSVMVYLKGSVHVFPPTSHLSTSLPTAHSHIFSFKFFLLNIIFSEKLKNSIQLVYKSSLKNSIFLRKYQRRMLGN